MGDTDYISLNLPPNLKLWRLVFLFGWLFILYFKIWTEIIYFNFRKALNNTKRIFAEQDVSISVFFYEKYKQFILSRKKVNILYFHLFLNTEPKNSTMNTTTTKTTTMAMKTPTISTKTTTKTTIAETTAKKKN